MVCVAVIFRIAKLLAWGDFELIAFAIIIVELGTRLFLTVIEGWTCKLFVKSIPTHPEIFVKFNCSNFFEKIKLSTYEHSRKAVDQCNNRHWHKLTLVLSINFFGTVKTRFVSLDIAIIKLDELARVAFLLIVGTWNSSLCVKVAVASIVGAKFETVLVQSITTESVVTVVVMNHLNHVVLWIKKKWQDNYRRARMPDRDCLSSPQVPVGLHFGDANIRIVRTILQIMCRGWVMKQDCCPTPNFHLSRQWRHT